MPLSRFMTGRGGVFGQGTLVCHCLLIETPADGLVLVDTGFGLDDLADPARRLGPMRHLLGAVFDPAECARSQVEALGFRAADVRHILITHMDLDHAGGLSDFPEARVHLLADEKAAALAASGLRETSRFRAPQWAHGPNWQTYTPEGETWNGFACVRELVGLPPEVVLVPLVGHTLGHAGIAVQDGDGWLLHCGDAYYLRETIAPVPETAPGMRAFQRAAATNYEQMLANQARLRELSARASDVRLFCAHDPAELDAF